MNRYGLLAGVCLMLSGCATPQYSVSTGPRAFLPQRGPVQPTGELAVAPDQPVLMTPVGFRRSARLKAPLGFEIAGKGFAFDGSSLLVTSLLVGKAAANVPRGARVFCGLAQVHPVKAVVALSTLGLSSLLNRTGSQTQVCLIDSEADAAFDKAVLIGVKSDADALPVMVGPAAYEALENEPMPGNSHASIIYRGKTGMLGGHISFDLKVIEAGTPLMFENVRTKVDIKELPKQVQLMGARFLVKSYDPATGKVTLDVERGFVEGEYGLQTIYRTQYIPIYIPG